MWDTYAVFRRRRAEEGAAAVELAMTLIPLLVLVFGIIQYGMYFYAAQTGTSVTREAVRKLSVGDCQSGPALTSFVQSRLTGASAGSLVVTPAYTDAGGVATTAPVTGGTVALHVEFRTLNLHFPFLPFLSDPKVVRDVDSRIDDSVSEGVCS